MEAVLFTPARGCDGKTTRAVSCQSWLKDWPRVSA